MTDAGETHSAIDCFFLGDLGILNGVGDEDSYDLMIRGSFLLCSYYGFNFYFFVRVALKLLLTLGRELEFELVIPVFL